MSENKEINVLWPGTRVMTNTGWKTVGEARSRKTSTADTPTAKDLSIIENLLVINEEIANKLSVMKSLMKPNNHEDDCWRCLPDDEQPVTFAWLEWTGFRQVRHCFYLDNFSFGPQIEFKWNAFGMQTTHNQAPITKRWEVRSLLAVHHDKLVEVGHGKIWEVAPEFRED